MKILAFTGAGISKQSNISTFMEQPEVREKLTRSYAQRYSDDYNQTIRELKHVMEQARPNKAHIALATNKIPIITMNIDYLHEQAGSQVLKLHGCLPEDEELAYAHTLYQKPVLYGDPAPNYEQAFAMVSQLKQGDVFLVIGCSYHTMIACQLREVAKYVGARIIEIQEDAANNVEKILNQLRKEEAYDHTI